MVQEGYSSSWRETEARFQHEVSGFRFYLTTAFRIDYCKWIALYARRNLITTSIFDFSRMIRQRANSNCGDGGNEQVM